MSLLTPFKHRGEIEPTGKEWEDFWQRAFDWEGDPFQQLKSWFPKVWERGGVPRLNFGEDDGNYTLALELPGLDEKDIKLQLIGNQLIISGERKWESEKKAKEYHRVECQYGSFRRAVTLPQSAKTDPDAIQARYDKGMLEITIPKVAPTPTVEIPVKPGKP
jgi:HSP20 family protein